VFCLSSERLGSVQRRKETRSRKLLIGSELGRGIDQQVDGVGGEKVVDDTWIEHVARPACRDCLLQAPVIESREREFRKI